MTESTYCKTNSFSQKPHPQQIASYLIFSVQTAVYFAIIRPNFHLSQADFIFTIMIGCSLFGVVVTTLGSSLIDPSDPIMIQYLTSSKHQKDCFEAKKKQDGQEMLYCTQCDSFVQKGSRHCRACKRCSSLFDHHCKWINNCVGRRNYRWFAAMITLALSNQIIFLAAVAFLGIQNKFQDFLASFVVDCVFAALAAILAFLLLNLVIFHVFITCKGITTVQFLSQKDDEERKARQQKWKQQMENKSREQAYIDNGIDSNKISQQGFNVNLKQGSSRPPIST